jgi:hypothetical protein
MIWWRGSLSYKEVRETTTVGVLHDARVLPHPTAPSFMTSPSSMTRISVSLSVEGTRAYAVVPSVSLNKVTMNFFEVESFRSLITTPPCYTSFPID